MAKGEWRGATWRPEEQRAVDCGPVLAGIRAGAGAAHIFRLQSSKHEHEFRDSACVFEYFLVFLQHRVRMSFSCLPSHPPMYWGVSYGGVLLGLAGAGSGGQRAVVFPRLSGAPERALYGS